MGDLTRPVAREALEAHYADIREPLMREFFVEDPDRAARLMSALGDLRERHKGA